MESRQWQSLLKQGNDCFNDNLWQQAEFFYSEAYDLLAYGYRNDPLCSEMMMAWICSCHNLSSLYERTGKLSLALRFLTVPHDYLKEVSESVKASDEIKLLAFKGLSLTLPPILSFSQSHPICDGCVEQFKNLKTMIDMPLQNMH